MQKWSIMFVMILGGLFGLEGSGTAASEPMVLARWKAAPQELVFAGDQKSGLLVAWTVQESSGSWIGVQRSGYSGDVLWEETGVSIGSSNGVKRDLRLAPDRRGGAILLWREEADQQSRFYVQNLTPRGFPNWPDPGILVSSSTQSSPIALDVDEKGRIFMAWEAVEDGTPRVRYQLASPEGRLLVGGGGGIVANGGDALMAPAVNDDGAGGFFIIWQSSDTTPRLLAQYFDPNQKPIWDPQGTVVTGEGGQASIHASVFTPYNKLVVLWREPSPIGVSWSAQCLDASGQRLWDANGIPLVEEDSDRVTSSAAVSPAGKITAVWEDAGQEPHVVYAQRWLRAGLPVWGFNGTGVVETPGGEETNPLVVAGSQDAFVFWQDNRNLSKKLYAQRLKDDGTPVLRDGVDLAPLGSSAGRIYGVPDVSGGAVVMWVEPTVSGLWQLLAERLNASGSVAW